MKYLSLNEFLNYHNTKTVCTIVLNDSITQLSFTKIQFAIFSLKKGLNIAISSDQHIINFVIKNNHTKIKNIKYNENLKKLNISIGLMNNGKFCSGNVLTKEIKKIK